MALCHVFSRPSAPLRFCQSPFRYSKPRFFSLCLSDSSKPSTRSTPDPAIDDPDGKKSFAVATGDFFMGFASRILKKRNNTIISWRNENSGLSLFKDSGKGRDGEFDESIGNIVEDDVEPGMVWEQRNLDVQAEKQREVITSPGFSFSAAGLLLPYHLGVAQLLIEQGYIKETTPLAGSSAGAITCAVIASGTTMREALQATKILANDCRQKGTAFRLGAVLRDILEKFLPEDVHLKCNGRVRVAVTQILWRPKSILIDQFDSKEDLINAVFTSSFIPGYLAPRPATMYRNRLCVDGGLTLFMPPTSAEKTVRVCCFPVGNMGFKGVGISPDLNPEFNATPRQLFNWALEPADDEILDKLFDFGYMDGSTWAQQNPLHQFTPHSDSC